MQLQMPGSCIPIQLRRDDTPDFKRIASRNPENQTFSFLKMERGIMRRMSMIMAQKAGT